MKRSRNPELKRQKIIKATNKLLKEGGYFTNFSLDSVAREAGVSKGGLMHHFASKDALLRAAAENAIVAFETQLKQKIETDEGAQSGKLSRAYVESVLGEGTVVQAELSPVLLGYLNSAETNPTPNRFQTWQARTEQDGIDTITATIVRLALDGIIYTELIDSEPIDNELRQQIRERMLDMLTA
ncbi:MAG: TetR/AcrR family transcriptional regulator [Candidatus Promineifilaceae bacterium]